MRQDIIVKTYLKFDELTEEQKEKAIELNFAQCPYHFEFQLQGRLDTLKKLASFIGGYLDYSISVVPSRGEFITIKDYNQGKLKEFTELKEDCPLTGVCYDEDIRDFVKKNNFDLDAALHDYLTSIHKEYEWSLSVEYITDLCEANGYEFDADTLNGV